MLDIHIWDTLPFSHIFQYDRGTCASTAARSGSAECLRILIAAKADVQRAGEIGRSPLFTACLRGYTDCVRLLIEEGCDVNRTEDDRLKTNCLCAAGQNGHVDCMALLIKANADIDAFDKDRDAAVHMACRKGQVDCLALLIKAGAQVNTPNEWGRTPVFLASLGGHAPCVNLLIRDKAEVDVPDKKGSTALQAAVQNDKIDCLELLLQAGANPNKRDLKGKTPACIAAIHDALNCLRRLIAVKADFLSGDEDGDNPVLYALRRGTLDCLNLLLDAGAPADVYLPDGRSSTFIACVAEQPACLQRLIQANVNLDEGDKDGTTPVYVCAQKGDTKCLDLLIKAKADVMKAENDGTTPMHIAARKGNLDCIKMLLEAKANVNQNREDGRSPVFFAALNGNTDCLRLLISLKADIVQTEKRLGATCLCAATQEGHEECLQLLLNSGAPVNQTMKDSRTPLFLASCHGQPGCARLLIAHKADVNKADSEGRVPAFTASLMGYADCLAILIEGKANLELADSVIGATPLCGAARGNRADCLELLLKAGVDINKAQNDGRTPVYIAARNGQVDVLRILLAAGADANTAAQDGKTPGCAAAEKGELEALKGLLEVGADLQKGFEKNGKSITPLDLANFNQHSDCVRLLQLAQSKPASSASVPGSSSGSITTPSRSSSSSITTPSGSKAVALIPAQWTEIEVVLQKPIGFKLKGNTIVEIKEGKGAHKFNVSLPPGTRCLQAGDIVLAVQCNAVMTRIPESHKQNDDIMKIFSGCDDMPRVRIRALDANANDKGKAVDEPQQISQESKTRSVSKVREDVLDSHQPQQIKQEFKKRLSVLTVREYALDSQQVSKARKDALALFDKDTNELLKRLKANMPQPKYFAFLSHVQVLSKKNPHPALGANSTLENLKISFSRHLACSNLSQSGSLGAVPQSEGAHFCGRLHDQLKTEEIEVWYDKAPETERLDKKGMVMGVANSACVCIYATKSYFKRPWCQFELQAAYKLGVSVMVIQEISGSSAIDWESLVSADPRLEEYEVIKTLDNSHANMYHTWVRVNICKRLRQEMKSACLRRGVKIIPSLDIGNKITHAHGQAGTDVAEEKEWQALSRLYKELYDMSLLDFRALEKREVDNFIETFVGTISHKAKFRRLYKKSDKTSYEDPIID
eukprot:g6427.t1